MVSARAENDKLRQRKLVWCVFNILLGKKMLSHRKRIAMPRENRTPVKPYSSNFLEYKQQIQIRIVWRLIELWRKENKQRENDYPNTGEE